MNSYTSENMISKHKQVWDLKETTRIRTSPESQIYWKNHFHRTPIYFRIHADFEADNENDKSSIGE